MWKEICDHMTKYQSIIRDAIQCCVLISCHKFFTIKLHKYVRQHEFQSMEVYKQAIKSHKLQIADWHKTILQMPSKIFSDYVNVWQNHEQIDWLNENHVLNLIVKDMQTDFHWEYVLPVKFLFCCFYIFVYVINNIYGFFVFWCVCLYGQKNSQAKYRLINPQQYLKNTNNTLNI